MSWTVVAGLLTAVNAFVAGLSPTTPWGHLAVFVVGLAATIAAKKAPAGLGGKSLEPTQTNPQDFGAGPAAGKASGEAFEAASRGPFKRG